MAVVELTIEREGYETIHLDVDGGGQYGLQSNSAGLGVPPVTSHFAEGAGDGGEYLGERVGMRPFFLGIRFAGEGRISTGELIRAFVSLTRARRRKPHAKLVATYETGEVFELTLIYQGGLELDYTKALPKIYEAVVAAVSPAPYWTARDALTFRVANDNEPVGILPYLAQLPVMASTAFDDIIVTNPGDVDAEVVWVLTGPGGPTPITINGEGFVFEAILAEDEVITITRTPRSITVLDQDGANRYPDLGPAPKFPLLPFGTSQVSVQMGGASPGHWEATDEVIGTNRVVAPTLRTVTTGWTVYSAAGGTALRATSGFPADDSAGYIGLSWPTGAAADGAVQVSAPVVAGEELFGSMVVWAKDAQKVVPVCQFVTNTGVPVGPLILCEVQELPASTPVRVGFTPSDIGPAPEGAGALRFMVSVDTSNGSPWQSSAAIAFAGSKAIISETDTAFFSGESDYAAWLGAEDGSASVLFRKGKVGQSSVSAFYKPRREVVY